MRGGGRGEGAGGRREEGGKTNGKGAGARYVQLSALMEEDCEVGEERYKHVVHRKHLSLHTHTRTS